MAAEVVAGVARLLAGAALRRRPHAHRRGRAGAVAGRGAARRRGPPPASMTYGLGRAEILSAQANGVTLLVLGGADRLRGDRAGWSPRPTCDGALVLVVALVGIAVNLAAARILGPRRRARAQPQRRGLLPAHPHRPLRLHRHRGRGDRDPDHRVRPRRPDRLAADRGADAARRLRAAEGLGPRVHGGGAGGARPRRDRPRARRAAGRGRGPRPARLGGHLRLPGAVGARRRRAPARTATSCGASSSALLEERFDVDHTTLQVDHEAAPQPPLQIEVAPHTGRGRLAAMKVVKPGPDREVPRGVVGGAEISQATAGAQQHLHGRVPGPARRAVAPALPRGLRERRVHARRDRCGSGGATGSSTS